MFLAFVLLFRSHVNSPKTHPFQQKNTLMELRGKHFKNSLKIGIALVSLGKTLRPLVLLEVQNGYYEVRK
jgi:hypothetical protein